MTRSIRILIISPELYCTLYFVHWSMFAKFAKFHKFRHQHIHAKNNIYFTLESDYVITTRTHIYIHIDGISFAPEFTRDVPTSLLVQQIFRRISFKMERASRYLLGAVLCQQSSHLQNQRIVCLHFGYHSSGRRTLSACSVPDRCWLLGANKLP